MQILLKKTNPIDLEEYITFKVVLSLNITSKVAVKKNQMLLILKYLFICYKLEHMTWRRSHSLL